MIELRQVAFSYGSSEVFSNVSLRFEAGSFYGIFGPNGGGKSTLLKLMTGELMPSSGEVLPRPVSSMDRARMIALVEQELPNRLPLTVRETVALGRYPWGRAAVVDAVVGRALEALDLTDLAARPYAALSGGEKQKVMLARALAQDTPVILLDEPASALDPGYRQRFYQLLRTCADNGKCVIMVSHDLFLAPPWLDQAILLYRGRVCCSGAPAQVLSGECCREAFGIRDWGGFPVPGVWQG